jgi:serine/threonine protein phosphatase PrpC/cytoskeletal protein RodZ
MSAANSPSSSLIVSVGVQCHVGKERTENQDRVTRASTPFGDLFVVADGVGGYQGGAEAAQATVEGFVSYLNSHGNFALPDALQQAARTVSADLLQRSAANHLLHGMGSTVVLCVVHGDTVTYAHMGDSRAYLVRDRQLRQLTRDHSVMERLVSQGVLTPAQAREHPDASVLTRALGQSGEVSLDVAEIRLHPYDGILLCSDGLWAYAQHAEMEAVATSNGLSPTAISEALLNLALKGGGGDNISIQFLRFSPAGAARVPTGGTAGAKILGMPRRLALPAAALASVLVAYTGYLAWDNLQHNPNKTEIASAKDDPDESEPPETKPERAPRPASTTKPSTKPAASTTPKPGDKPTATTPANTTPNNRAPANPATSNPASANPASAKPAESPNPGAPQAPPPAAPPTQTQTPTSSSPPTPITIIQGPENVEAAWAKNLSTLNFLAVSKQTGSTDCLALAKSTDVLYFTAQTAGVAKNIREKLTDPIASQEKTADELAKCGSAQIIAMPAKSTRFQTGINKLKQKMPTPTTPEPPQQ